MNDVQIISRTHEPSISTSSRDLLAVSFRQKRRIAMVFVGIFLGAVLCAIFLPRKYEAEMKILVKHERQDPALTSDPRTPPSIVKNEVVEEDVNSEIELITSHDLLQQVVAASGLEAKDSFWNRMMGIRTRDQRISAGVHILQRGLRAQAIKKSNLIDITYRSTDPELAARVLSQLAGLYMTKHLAVHRPPGEYEFFQKQADQYKRQLKETESRLAQFSRDNGTVSAQADRDFALQKANEAEYLLRDTNSAIKQVNERIRDLQQQLKATPVRVVTSDRNGNAQLMSQLKANLLTLELKRTEMLTKYAPGYPPVQEVQQQIAQTSAAIAEEEKTPLREITTDRNPTSQLLNDDLARALAERASLEAKAAGTSRMLQQYRTDSERLYQTSLTQQDLLRAAKAAEDSYQLYFSRGEEARIADELDKKRMVNVAVAEAAAIPDTPVHSGFYYLLFGTMLAIMASIGSAFAAEYFDQRFRNPAELESYLNVPLLAAIPEENN